MSKPYNNNNKSSGGPVPRRSAALGGTMKDDLKGWQREVAGSGQPKMIDDFESEPFLKIGIAEKAEIMRNLIERIKANQHGRCH